MSRNWTIGACVILAMAAPALPALAQTAKTPPAAAPAPAPDPAFDAAKAAAIAMGADTFATIQQDLIWTGDLNTLPSGELGKRSFDAIRAFQKRIKAADTGILTPPQRETLAQHAAKFIKRYGFTVISERGITLGYPAALVTDRTDGKNGPHFSTPKLAKSSATVDILSLSTAKESFEDLFARLKTENPKRKVTYSLLRPDFFVVSGVNDGRNFYIRFVKKDDSSDGFVLGWAIELSPEIDRVAIAMAASLNVGDSAAAPAPKPAAPAKTVEAAPPAEPAKPKGPPVPLAAGAPTSPKTGIGIVVSDKGDILTYAKLIAGCEKVTLPGGGQAQVLGGDVNNDIAVVRASSPAGLAPLAWRTEPLADGEAVSLLAGPAPVSAAVSGLTGTGGDTRRVTLNTGGTGAIIDKDGALAGLAAGDGSAVGLKALFTLAFLRANGATPPAKGGDPTKAVLSLTCTPGS